MRHAGLVPWQAHRAFAWGPRPGTTGCTPLYPRLYPCFCAALGATLPLCATCLVGFAPPPPPLVWHFVLCWFPYGALNSHLFVPSVLALGYVGLFSL